MAFLAKLKKLVSKTSDEACNTDDVVSRCERRRRTSLVALATAAQGDDAEAFFPRLFLQAVRPRRIIIERPISHGVLVNWFLTMVDRGCLSIPEVNRILGVKCLPSNPAHASSPKQLGSESFNEGGSRTSINSVSTIAVSPPLFSKPFSEIEEPSCSLLGGATAEKLTFQDFVLQGTLGSGTYGAVKLAQHNSSGKLVALKMVSKQFPLSGDAKRDVTSSQRKHLIASSGKTLAKPESDVIETSENEKNESTSTLGLQQEEMAQRWEITLEEFFSMRRMEGVPWTVDLIGSFHDTDNFYFVMPCYPGGSLQSFMDCNKGRIPYDQARTYMAHLLLGLEALQHHGIVHRDIKPGNILIDETGHLVIADFGLAKCFVTHLTPLEKRICGIPIEESSSGSEDGDESTGGHQDMDQTVTACGTPEYAAPEIYLGEAYSYPVDVWAVGVIAFRMFIGRSPWGNLESVKDLADAIVRGRFRIEKSEIRDFNLPPEVEFFLRESLDKHQISRPSATDLKSYAMFDHFPWDELSKRKLPTPWVPVPFTPRPAIPAVTDVIKDSNLPSSEKTYFAQEDLFDFFDYISPDLSQPESTAEIGPQYICPTPALTGSPTLCGDIPHYILKKSRTRLLSDSRDVAQLLVSKESGESRAIYDRQQPLAPLVRLKRWAATMLKPVTVQT